MAGSSLQLRRLVRWIPGAFTTRLPGLLSRENHREVAKRHRPGRSRSPKAPPDHLGPQDLQGHRADVLGILGLPVVVAVPPVGGQDVEALVPAAGAPQRPDGGGESGQFGANVIVVEGAHFPGVTKNPAEKNLVTQVRQLGVVAHVPTLTPLD